MTTLQWIGAIVGVWVLFDLVFVWMLYKEEEAVIRSVHFAARGE